MTYNTGDIKFSRTLSETEYDSVKRFIAEKWPGFTEKYQEVHLDFNGVSLCGTVEPDIADFIEDLAKAVEPLGIFLSGSVDCNGDTDGVVYIERDGVHYYGALDRWKKEATNQELLDVLRQRLDDKITSPAVPCDPNGEKREARPANPFISKTTDDDLAQARKMMEDIDANPFDHRIQAKINKEAKSWSGNTKWWEIIAVYEDADAKGRAACDDLLTALCGWTMHTILHSILLSPADTTTHDEMTSTPASMAQQREKPGMKVNNITGNVKEAASLSDLADVTFENNSAAFS